MVEYIEREAALDASDVYETFDGDDEIYFQYVPIEAIKELPAADVQPVRHGDIASVGAEIGVDPFLHPSLRGEGKRGRQRALISRPHQSLPARSA